MHQKLYLNVHIYILCSIWVHFLIHFDFNLRVCRSWFQFLTQFCIKNCTRMSHIHIVFNLGTLFDTFCFNLRVCRSWFQFFILFPFVKMYQILCLNVIYWGTNFDSLSHIHIVFISGTIFDTFWFWLRDYR